MTWANICLIHFKRSKVLQFTIFFVQIFCYFVNVWIPEQFFRLIFFRVLKIVFTIFTPYWPHANLFKLVFLKSKLHPDLYCLNSKGVILGMHRLFPNKCIKNINILTFSNYVETKMFSHYPYEPFINYQVHRHLQITQGPWPVAEKSIRFFFK